MVETTRLPGEPWRSIERAFEDHRRFLITTHVHPDGDGLGAELGLWAYLRSRGKDARIVNSDAVTERYAFLDGEGQFERYDPAVHDLFIASCEVAVLLDFSRWDRIGRLEGPIRNSGALTVCIDHHPGTGGPADLNGIDTGASSTGQLVYELLRPLGHPFDPRMATGFYVSILTDTGSFRFSNSDPRAHRAAAELLAHGLEPSRLYEHVYGNWSVGRLRLLGRVLDAMRLEAGGRIILLPVPRESIDATGADSTDAEGFVDIARSAAVCRCVVLLLEQRDGRIKVSLRSKGTVDVNAVAGRLGGGGHLYAAATVLDGPLDAAARAVLAELVPALDAAPDEGAAR